jgi:hypothetical protein
MRRVETAAKTDLRQLQSRSQRLNANPSKQNCHVSSYSSALSYAGSQIVGKSDSVRAELLKQRTHARQRSPSRGLPDVVGSVRTLPVRRAVLTSSEGCLMRSIIDDDNQKTDIKCYSCRVRRLARVDVAIEAWNTRCCSCTSSQE